MDDTYNADLIKIVEFSDFYDFSYDKSYPAVEHKFEVSDPIFFTFLVSVDWEIEEGGNIFALHIGRYSENITPKKSMLTKLFCFK